MRLFLIALALPIIGVLWIAAILIPAHWQIRQIAPPLPTRGELQAAVEVAGAPTGISYINTATQRGPLGTIGHPGILLQWSDGKSFLIDTGMPPERAIAFGKPVEQLLRGEPTQTFGALHTQLGSAIDTIAGIGFTHLHSDHTDGLPPLCATQARAATVFQSADQRERLNYTTRGGDATLRGSACPRAVLDDTVIKPLPGFPGLVAVAAAGHTPGSTLYAARVNDRIWIFAGDITNDMHSLHTDRDKPWLYTTFVVPENNTRLRQLRQWLEALDATPEFEVLVAHDIEALAASAIPRWR